MIVKIVGVAKDKDNKILLFIVHPKAEHPVALVFSNSIPPDIAIELYESLPKKDIDCLRGAEDGSIKLCTSKK